MAARPGDNHVLSSANDDNMLRFDLGTWERYEFEMHLTQMDIGRMEALLNDEDVDIDKSLPQQPQGRVDKQPCVV